MITLKKSFELQNYLTGLLNDAIIILSQTSNITTTKQLHLRKKAYSQAENEEIIVKKEEHPYTVNQLVDFVEVLICEIEKLTNAINDAKNSGSHDFDSMISTNKKKRTLLKCLERMAQLKPHEEISKGVAEKFNEDGEQVTYRYDIEQVTTIDYDRNEIKKKVSKLRKELDDTSNEIDQMQLSFMVSYSPIFEIGNTLDDVVEEYYAK